MADSEEQIPDPFDSQEGSQQDDEEIPEPFNDVAEVQNADGVPLPLESLDEDAEEEAADEASQLDDGDGDFAPSGAADDDVDIDMGMMDDEEAPAASEGGAEVDAAAAAPEKEDRPPKPPRRPFDIFIKDKRENLTEEESAMPRHQITRQFSNLWTNLDPEEKQTYEEAAEEDVERYRRQCQKYKRRHPEWEIPRIANTEPASSSSSSHDASGHSQKKRRKRLKQAAGGGSQRKKRRAAVAANDYIDEKRARAREMRAQDVGSVAEADTNDGGGGGYGDGFIAADHQKAVAPQLMELDKVIDQLKPKRSQDEVDPAAISGAVKMFLAKMDEAQLADRKAFRNKKPAVRKLRMLKEVSAQLRKKVLQEALLDNHILARMRDWLRPMPDGSLPNLNLRTELYSLLEVLPVDQDNLIESEGLGTEIMELWRHPKETVENKRVLHKLISTWLRPLVNSSIDYKDLAQEESSGRKAEVMRQRRERIRARERKFNDADRPRARIPDKAWFDFSRRPESRNQSEAEAEKSERMRNSQANPKRMRVVKRFDKLGRTGDQRSLRVSGSRAVRL